MRKIAQNKSRDQDTTSKTEQRGQPQNVNKMNKNKGENRMTTKPKYTLGDKIGCEFGDTFLVEMTPAEALSISVLHSERALKESSNYYMQGMYRTTSDKYTKIYEKWKELRSQKDIS